MFIWRQGDSGEWMYGDVWGQDGRCEWFYGDKTVVVSARTHDHHRALFHGLPEVLGSGSIVELYTVTQVVVWRQVVWRQDGLSEWLYGGKTVMMSGCTCCTEKRRS